MHISLIVLLGLALLLLGGCPQQNSSDAQAGTTATASADPHSAAAAHSEAGQADADSADAGIVNPNAQGEAGEAAMQRVRDMVKALQDGDRAAFLACFLPESRELEEMTAMFDEWQGSGNTIEIVKLEVSAADDRHALVDYEFRISEGGAEPETEDGAMELMKDEQGNWVINDLG
ncbi:MAG: hypothetical protein R3F46_00845 [bacterium]